jgi:hypothetical protein
MDGEQALATANAMNLSDSYEFYIDSYTETSPPMLDVAKTFRRFGTKGGDYVVERAANARNHEEFEADMMALSILDYKCAEELKLKLHAQSKRLGAKRSYDTGPC